MLWILIHAASMLFDMYFWFLIQDTCSNSCLACLKDMELFDCFNAFNIGGSFVGGYFFQNL